MKTATICILTAALSASVLFACGDDTGGSGSGSGGAGGQGGSNNGSAGNVTNGTAGGPSGNTSTTTGSSTTGGVTSSTGSGEGAGGPGGGGIGGGLECGDPPFLCGDGSCIPDEWVCDAIADCEDESDEAPINPSCPVFTCDDGTTIPANYECDIEVDCEDESDEFPVNPACDPPPETPEGWSCSPYFYGSEDGCDCGCGAVDLDCADSSVVSCDFCDADGACDFEGGDGDCATINPDDNSTCI